MDSLSKWVLRTALKQREVVDEKMKKDEYILEESLNKFIDTLIMEKYTSKNGWFMKKENKNLLKLYL